MTENEFRTGLAADGARLGPSNYLTDAARTLSPAWHGDKVAKAQFLGRINGAIDAANKLDQVKKTLFYGRDNNLIADGQSEIADYVEFVDANVIHGIIGIFTEAGELLEALRDGYNGAGLDPVNVKEEIGDLFWYVAILCNEFGFNFDDIQRINIAKLRARFPEKFEAMQANERNLENERAILEGGEQLTESLRNPLPHVGLEPTEPVSGPEAVLATTDKADAAFNAVKAVTPDVVDAGDVMKTTPEMSGSIGYRQGDMPTEKLARQPIRKSDV